MWIKTLVQKQEINITFLANLEQKVKVFSKILTKWFDLRRGSFGTWLDGQVANFKNDLIQSKVTIFDLTWLNLVKSLNHYFLIDV